MAKSVDLQASLRANIIFLISGIMFFLIIPFISRSTGIPVYYIEPMRWVALIGVVHFNRWSAYVMGLILPFISYLVFTHPPVDKAAIISIELITNIFLFLWFKKKMIPVFFSMFTAVIASKIICYLIYLAVYDREFFRSETTPDFLISQGVVTLLISTYAWIWLTKKTPV